MVRTASTVAVLALATAARAPEAPTLVGQPPSAVDSPPAQPGAAVPQAGPPASLAAGRINPQVAAMKSNTWLKLPTPPDHPISRSSSPWMAYAPEAGVGILWGCSHAGYPRALKPEHLPHRSRWPTSATFNYQ